MNSKFGSTWMKLVPIQSVRAQLRSGAPLPWGVRDANGKLLLARGYVVASDEMLNNLMERGMFVDADEVRAAAAKDGPQASGTFFERWSALQNRLAAVLRTPGEALFLTRIGEAVNALSMLSERNADQLIFAIIRHDHGRYSTYGTSHSLHVATVCALLGRKLDWPRAKVESLIGAALTMNLSIIELQGTLAAQGGRPTAEQQARIKAHPVNSANLLRKANLQDQDWLTAVEQHHEESSGKGYPKGLTDPTEMSQFLRLIDIFTAKHAGRADRLPVPAQQAARELYLSSNGSVIGALLIKEFGIYPPGCFVKLASGETAIVVRRGAAANTPVAAAICNRNGDALLAPIRRETSAPEFAITSTIADSSVMVRVPMDKLYPESS